MMSRGHDKLLFRVRLFIAIVFLFAVSCQRHSAPPPSVVTLPHQNSAHGRNYEAEGFTKGMIIDNRELDGCTFMIITQTGTVLQPIRLDPSYAIDSLGVWVRFDEAKDYLGTCMSGTPIVIKEIARE